MKLKLNPRKQAVQERSQQTIDAILEATAQLLNDGKLEGASTNHIAAKAGVSIGSLYQYFPNKESVFRKVVEIESLKRKKEFTQFIESARDETLEESSRMLVHILTDIFFRRQRFNAFFIKNFYSPQLFNFVAQNEDEVQELLLLFLKSKRPKWTEKEVREKSFVVLHATLGVLRAATFFENRKMKREDVERMTLDTVLKLIT